MAIIQWPHAHDDDDDANDDCGHYLQAFFTLALALAHEHTTNTVKIFLMNLQAMPVNTINFYLPIK